MKKIIIAAVAKNGVMGRTTGEMPWHNSAEFQHFKNTTFGYPVIMGRKSFDSLGKPLKGRLNIILSRNRELKTRFDDVKIFDSLNDAYNFCESQNFKKAFVIGGSYIFKEAINSVDEMILSIMDFDAVGDLCFPEFSKDNWDVIYQDKRDGFEIFHYVRKVKIS